MMTTSPNQTANLRDFFEKFDDSKRAVARLMARENITVVVDATADTAWFELNTRVLTIPNWPLSTDQCDMLLAHEIGHALYTDPLRYIAAEYSRDGIRLPGMNTYLNILEDIRIERRIQQAYPGMVGVFTRAYAEFTATGPIFQCNVTDGTILMSGEWEPIAGYSLITRLNLHFKIGRAVTIPFSDAEQAIVVQCNELRSIDDVIRLARKIYYEDLSQMSKKDRDAVAAMKALDREMRDLRRGAASLLGEPVRSTRPFPSKGEDELSTPETSVSTRDGEEIDGDVDTDEDRRHQPARSMSAGRDPEGQTAVSEDKAVDAEEEDKDDENDAVDVEDDEEEDDLDDEDDEDDYAGDRKSEFDALKALDALNEYMKTMRQQHEERLPRVPEQYVMAQMPDALFDAQSIDATTFSSQVHDYLLKYPQCKAAMPVLERAFKHKYDALIQSMVQDFTRRRHAKVDARSHVGKTGRLDMGKLSQYRFAEDLFKRVRIVPDGQSHGIVMVIDASGSMNTVFADVLEQVMLFAHFTHTVNVPFQAYLFQTSQYNVMTPERLAKRNAARRTLPMRALMPPDDLQFVCLVDTTVAKISFKQQMQALSMMWFAHVKGTIDGVDVSVKSPLYGMPYNNLYLTPLHGGLLMAEKAIERMKRRYALDKTTLVTVSDGGDGSSLLYHAHPRVKVDGVPVTTPSDDDDDDMLTARYDRSPHAEFLRTQLRNGLMVRDQITKKLWLYASMERSPYTNVERLVSTPNAELTMLYDIIAHRHGTRTIHMHIHAGAVTRKYRNDPTRYLNVSYASMVRVKKDDAGYALADKAMLEAFWERKDEQFQLPDGLGCAQNTVIILSDALELVENEFDEWDFEGKTVAAIVRQFNKQAVKATSRRQFTKLLMPSII